MLVTGFSWFLLFYRFRSVGLIDRFILSMRGIFEKVGIIVYSYSEEKSTLYPKLRDFSHFLRNFLPPRLI